MNAHQRAAKLMEDAVKLGCGTPTEAMIAEAIHDAECDAFNDYAFTLPKKWHDHCLRIQKLKQLEKQT
jgi:hypothetical protein